MHFLIRYLGKISIILTTVTQSLCFCTGQAHIYIYIYRYLLWDQKVFDYSYSVIYGPRNSNASLARFETMAPRNLSLI